MNTNNAKDSKVPVLGREAWTAIIIALFALILILTTLVWNGRYKAGFNAGERDGAEYKPYKELYVKLEETIPDYQQQLEQDRREINRLTRKIAQLETKRGWLDKRSSEIEIEDLREQLWQRLDAVAIREVELNQSSEQVGELRNQVQQDQLIISDLKAEQQNDQQLAHQLIAGSIIELVVIVALLGYIFFRTNNALQSGYPQAAYEKAKTISISPLEDSTANALQGTEIDQQEQKALPPDS